MNISVIIPIYNVEAYIERCLLSVMNQTFTEGVECILVNDCTPDNSIKIAENLINKYKGDILFRIISHKCNRGIAASRNTGLYTATGTYILYIDSDDYIERTMLEEMYTEAIRTNADIVESNFYRDYGNYKQIAEANRALLSKEEHLQKTILRIIPITIWGRLIKKTLFTMHSIKCIEGINFGEDYYILIQLLYYTNKYSYINMPLYNYNKVNIKALTSQNNLQRIKSDIKTFQLVETFLRKTNLYFKYRPYIRFFYFNAKKDLLLSPTIRDYKLWKELCSESNMYIWEYKISFLSKLFYTIVLHIPSILFPAFISLYDYINKLFSSPKKI